MANDTRFIDALSKRIRLSVHTFAPARVVRYYSGSKEADIELLFMSVDKSGATEKYPLVERAPVLKHVGALSANQVVFVAFAERALDNLQSRPFDPDAHRMHDVRDAVVLGVLEL